MRTISSLVFSYVPVLMVLGLLTPIFGPAIDHHYVDRSPAHTHLHVGAETNVHDHSLDDHDHDAGETTSDGISIASSSASSAPGAHGPITLDGAALESSIPDLDTHLIAIHVGEPPVPDDKAISPLDRPPRRV